MYLFNAFFIYLYLFLMFFSAQFADTGVKNSCITQLVIKLLFKNLPDIQYNTLAHVIQQFYIISDLFTAYTIIVFINILKWFSFLILTKFTKFQF